MRFTFFTTQASVTGRQGRQELEALWTQLEELQVEYIMTHCRMYRVILFICIHVFRWRCSASSLQKMLKFLDSLKK